jgi:hypothetical protein
MKATCVRCQIRGNEARGDADARGDTDSDFVWEADLDTGAVALCEGDVRPLRVGEGEAESRAERRALAEGDGEDLKEAVSAPWEGEARAEGASERVPNGLRVEVGVPVSVLVVEALLEDVGVAVIVRVFALVIVVVVVKDGDEDSDKECEGDRDKIALPLPALLREGELDAEGEAAADLLAGVEGDADTEREARGDADADFVGAGFFDAAALALGENECAAVMVAARGVALGEGDARRTLSVGAGEAVPPAEGGAVAEGERVGKRVAVPAARVGEAKAERKDEGVEDAEGSRGERLGRAEGVTRGERLALAV